jgi:hypothetical protein
MSTLKADTIVAADGSSPVTLTKQSAAKTLAKLDADAVIDESFNTSSAVDNGTGIFSINLTSNMSSSLFVTLTNTGNTKHFQSNESVRTSSLARILTFSNSHTYQDVNDMNFALHGDLA